MKQFVAGSACLFAFLGLGTGLVAQDGRIVVIDPGHGGETAGVEVAGIREKDVVLRAAFVLAEELVMRGFDVRVTRTGDYDVPINDRRVMAEEVNAVAFISLHFNGSEDTTSDGIEIYANPDNSASLQAARAVASALEHTGGPVVVEARPWGFLASPTVPTVMIEAGFLTHPVERRLIMSRAHHRDLARWIADGIEAYLESYD